MSHAALIETLCAGRSLSVAEAEALFAQIVHGEVEPLVLSALLTALKAKGEAPSEIAGAALALRRAAVPFDRGALDVADSCGTGGDGAGTANISTAAAVVAAELGLSVVKHGNRSVSSLCGSADVLEQCGVRLDASPETSAACLREEGICFLFAPAYHSGMRHAMPVRRALKTRTIFNLVGPLANPASPRWQVVGVYDPALCRPLAETLRLVGCEAALVVHGAGLDEVALHDVTTAARLRPGGAIEEITLTPAELGLQEHPIAALKGGSPEENGAWLQGLLAGRGAAAHESAVAANAGVLLWIAGHAANPREGVTRALDVIRVGSPARRLARWAERSQQ